MQLFFADDISSNSAILKADEARHCVKVLRHQPGDSIHITNGQGIVWEAIITHTDKKEVTVTLEKAIPGFGEHEYRIQLAFSPLRLKDRLEWLVEKAVELGVTDLIPVRCERTDKYKANFKPERIQTILLTATKQCLRSKVPTLHEYQSLENYLTNIPRPETLNLIARSDAEEGMPDLTEDVLLTQEISLLIGPEGDFTDKEYETAISQGFRPIHLGHQRLRSETAAVYALGAVKLFKGY